MNQETERGRTPSLLARLRSLIPNRPLRFDEACRLVELQAATCRRLLNITSPELPEGSIAGIPRVSLLEASDLPSSAVTQWHNGRWLIVINGREPWQRQRFSAAHELWHGINWKTEQWLCTTDRRTSSVRKREQLADYFAGCLLMPKQHLKRLWGEGLRDEDLANTFGVSVRAVEVRLAQLGLQDRRRCSSDLDRTFRTDWRYSCRPSEAA